MKNEVSWLIIRNIYVFYFVGTKIFVCFVLMKNKMLTDYKEYLFSEQIIFIDFSIILR